MKHRHPIKLQSLRQVLGAVVVTAAGGLLLAVFVPVTAFGPLTTTCGCGTVITRTRADLFAEGGVLAVGACCAFALCAIVVRVCWLASRSISEPDICSRFGLDPEALRQVTAERGIAPAFLIGSTPHYDIRDFGDASTLLRGASAESQPDALLRAAGPSAPLPDPNASESLLRADPHAPKTAQPPPAESN